MVSFYIRERLLKSYYPIKRMEEVHLKVLKGLYGGEEEKYLPFLLFLTGKNDRIYYTIKLG